MSIFVDTSVWSLALRRDVATGPHVHELARLLEAGEICSTGIVLQELLQGFGRPKFFGRIVERLSTIPLLVPDRDDHVHAAELRNACRRKGVQAGTIDALLAQLCLRYELTMLTTDQDFLHIARIAPLRLWAP